MCVKVFHSRKSICMQQLLLQGVNEPACSLNAFTTCLCECRLSVRVGTYWCTMCRITKDFADKAALI